MPRRRCRRGADLRRARGCARRWCGGRSACSGARPRPARRVLVPTRVPRTPLRVASSRRRGAPRALVESRGRRARLERATSSSRPPRLYRLGTCTMWYSSEPMAESQARNDCWTRRCSTRWTRGSPTSACGSWRRRSAPATACSSTTSGRGEGLLVAVAQAVEATQREMVFGSGVSRAPEDAREFWKRISSPKLWPQERLFFELYVHALLGRPGTEGSSTTSSSRGSRRSRRPAVAARRRQAHGARRRPPRRRRRAGPDPRSSGDRATARVSPRRSIAISDASV